ncbi:cytochrome P450 [Phenylobacterium sp.]|uniref:cytochrome P450 n=1 Tax=Phenylobacterium sp. TaxID=1871053 RepID=UPI00301C4E7C
MDDGSIDLKQAAAAEAWSVPIEALNPAQPDLFAADAMWPVFERLRKEAPVHWAAPNGEYDGFWSISRYADIMTVDTNHQVFSSADNIVLQTIESKIEGDKRPRGSSFIAMDPPGHDVQRKAVSPAVAPANLAAMAPLIRERAGAILDGLPIGREFDWVDLVSKELTAMTLATLFDYPQERRRDLTFWSDMFTNAPGHGPAKSWEHKREQADACFAAFDALWAERVNAEPRFDLVSMMAHAEATRNLGPHDYHSNVVLLIIGGNDTTRNTISGSVYALNKHPDQCDKLRANPSLVTSMVSETIRWQTPLAHMARTATSDFELGGQTIRAGDRVVMWYVSGNRDDAQIENPNAYIIDRERPRNHLSFGFGIHRCVGNRLAELQLTIIWEEILKRFPEVRLVREPERTHSVFVKGYETLPVIIPTRN